MDMNESAERICRNIDDAFAGIAWPAAHNLVQNDSRDGFTFKEMQTPYVIQKFGGKRREQFEKEIQQDYIEDFIPLSDHAKLYYLPCFLKVWLTMRDDFFFSISMIGLLNNDSVKPDTNIWPEFTPSQREVICNTLEFVRQHIKSYDLMPSEQEYREKLHSAICYWSS